LTSAYEFTFATIKGEPYPLADLAGRPLLVVNTASKCGFTPQYKGLETVWQAYKDKGLVVIGVPSNDFAGQEPGSAAEIATFCEVNYGVDFPIMGKVHVKGRKAHPFFAWVGGQGGFLASPKWNFFKYLITREGQLKTWFSSVAAPESPKVMAAIESVL
jgi:glutathione peroxidase